MSFAALAFAVAAYFNQTTWVKDARAPVGAVKPQAPVVTSAQAAAQFVASTAPQAVTPPQEDEIVARQSSLDDNLGLDLGAARLTRSQMADVQKALELQIAARQPAAEAVRKPAPEAAIAAQTGLFAASSAASGGLAECRKDLQKITDAARVYFPSGGVTPEQAGIEQGSIIAMIADSCPGVRIRVEGHSDASGDPTANLRLSQLRAEEVIQRVRASGVDVSMFLAEGLGDVVPSGMRGPQPAAYYDRRVEFSLLEGDVQIAGLKPFTPNPWAESSCVKELENAATNTSLFYAARSVSPDAPDLDIAMDLAEMAANCPYARLRVFGYHSGDAQSGETPSTANMRVRVLMAMLVGRGAPADQIIIGSTSVPWNIAQQPGTPGSRVTFDIILEES